ncbi:hypothetical protein JOD64_000745 [Micromonospora luteifusca]|uniref:Uncharacterized protein n=1 Tax=Micromonospora luteifusca TaxID=709860 RepID=A0ABS2LMU9_9ACTN|nr:hypothetical protein [Micromonospora luteifusca]
MSMLDVLLGSSPGRSWTEGRLDGMKARHIAAYS